MKINFINMSTSNRFVNRAEVSVPVSFGKSYELERDTFEKTEDASILKDCQKIRRILTKNAEIPADEISFLVENTDSEKIPFLLTLAKDKIYPDSKLDLAVRSVNSDENQKIYALLKADKDIPGDELRKHLPDIFNNMDCYNLDKLKKIYFELSADKNVQAEIIPGLLLYSINMPASEEKNAKYFLSLCGKKNISELSVKDKREFLSKILQSKKMIEANVLKDNVQILPKNTEEYIDTVKNLTLQLNTPPDNLKKTDELLENAHLRLKNNLEKIYQSDEYKKLSVHDQKILTIAVLHQCRTAKESDIKEIAQGAYFTAKHEGLSDEQASKAYKLVENVFLTDKYNLYGACGIQDEEILNLIAFNLKENNLFEMQKMMYPLRYETKTAQDLAEKLKQRIFKIKSCDFILPQTPASEYQKLSKSVNIKGYDVKLVKSRDIKDFYAFVHTPSLGLQNRGSTKANIGSFEAFKLIEDDKILSASYINRDNYGLAYKDGFIIEAAASDQLTASYFDMHIKSKTVPELISECYIDSKDKNNKSRFRYRFGDTMSKGLFLTKKEYVKRLDNIKKHSQKPSLEDMKKIDPRFCNGFKEILEKHFFRLEDNNEVVLRRPKIIGIYTKNYTTLSEDYLKFAQENDLPIVVLN